MRSVPALGERVQMCSLALITNPGPLCSSTSSGAEFGHLPKPLYLVLDTSLLCNGFNE